MLRKAPVTHAPGVPVVPPLLVQSGAEPPVRLMSRGSGVFGAKSAAAVSRAPAATVGSPIMAWVPAGMTDVTA